MNLLDQREAVCFAIEKKYPLVSHSGGSGCGGWDLGFFMKGQAESDQRSLELSGTKGHIKARIVENYRGERFEGEPSRELIFGDEKPQRNAVLPPSTVAAIEAMLRAGGSEGA